MNLAVFSLWTGTKDHNLSRNLAMLFSAAIAYAGAAFKKIELVTDNDGLEIASRLGWHCTSYSHAIQGEIPKSAKHVWMLGKLVAQQIQTEPFAHIDLDFLVFTPLPSRLSRATVFAQSLDHPASYQDSYVQQIEKLVGIAHDQQPYNTGIIGWNDIEFMRDYCRAARSMAMKAAPKFQHGGCISIVCEQMLLGQMARERAIRVETAIPLPIHTHRSDMKDFKFAHFWGGAKHNETQISRLERRFKKEHPVEYARFLKGWELLGKKNSIRYGVGITLPIQP